MRGRVIIALCLGGFLLGPGPCGAAENESATPEEIKQLVGQLGGTSKEAAARAEKRLAEIGPPALAALREAIFQNKNQPAARAARTVVEQIARKAQQTLTAKLTRIKAAQALIERVTDEAVAAMFPGTLAFAVRFPQFPVALRPRPPLKQQNLFIMDKDGQFDHITDFKGLESFFRENTGRVLKEDRARISARAWLALSQQLVQDGFFKFSIPDRELKAREFNGMKVTGKAVVKPERGNKGFIQVTITYGMDGFLDLIEEQKTLLTGKRPR